jgi:hypothetical protein
VGLQEAPHLQDPKQNHSENAKSGNSKEDFFVFSFYSFFLFSFFSFPFDQTQGLHTHHG